MKLTRRWLLVWILGGCQWVASANAADEQRPNIVFIFADDLGINDLSVYGRADQSTPNLDRLAAGGMRFTQAYSAQSVCSPTRAAILTGKTPARLHLTNFLPGRAEAPSQRLLQPKIEQALPLAEKTVPEYLSPAGYVSGAFGKWHLGGKGFGPKEQGFTVAESGQANTKPSADEGGKGEYGLTALAEKFLDENRERPFFLYLAYNNPHVPLGAKPELVARHEGSFNPLYAAMIESLDECVGRIVAKLEALGLREKTLLVFTSDNGGLHVPELPSTPATHNTPFRAGKGFLYEGGLRVPLIVSWPGQVKAGALNATPVISTDWLATWLELAHQPVPAGLDGVSLKTELLGGSPLAARPLYWHFPHYSNQGGRPGGAIRDGDWKLIEHYEDGRAELFNLASDPGELTNLGAKEPKRVAEMRGKLATWRQDVGAQENEANPSYSGALHRQLYEQVDLSRLVVAATAKQLAEPLHEWRTLMDSVVVPNANRVVGPVVALPGRTAEVHGTSARYEPQPQKNTIGFWTKVEDWASWEFTLAQPGVFEVEILQGAGSGGSEVALSVGEQSLNFTVEGTGHFQNFVPRVVGRLNLGAGSHRLEVRPKTKVGGAVMDLRQVTLLPVAP